MNIPGHGFNCVVVLRLNYLGSRDEMLTLLFFVSHLQFKDNNALTGAIPIEFGNLVNLDRLFLSK